MIIILKLRLKLHTSQHSDFTIDFILLLNFKESFFNYLNLGEKVADFSERSSRRFSTLFGFRRPSALIESTDNALKIVWVKRLCANDERPWKFIPPSLLSNVGGSLLFQCNNNIQYLSLNENLPKFYRDIMSHWQKIKNTNPKTKDVLNEIIWNNYFIRVNKSSVFFPCWKNIGIGKVSCLFDNENNTFLTFTTFMQKYT